jgi:DUF2948 family protein
VAPDGTLKLRAEDADDLAVISGLVQDALISVRDLTYDRAERRFTLVVNRFRWEGASPDHHDGEKRVAWFERTLCAVSFAEVERVTYRGFRRRDDERILSLLAVRIDHEPGGDAAGTIELEFSGGAALRLTVGAIRVRARDVGEPWPTVWQPDHEADERR